MLDLGELVGKLRLDSSGWDATIKRAESDAASIGSVLSKAAAIGAAGLAAAGVAAAAFGAGLGSVLDAGSQMESFESRLTTMMGSAVDAHERLSDLVDFAASTPFEIPGIVEAEVIMQGFGVATEEVMGGVIDFAAGAGAELAQSAVDIGKAWNQGATGLESDAGKILRAGIEARTGVDATTLSIEKFREALKAELDFGKFAGGAMRLSTTFEGMVSNLIDMWGSFKREIADAGVFNNVKMFLASMLNLIGQNKAAITELAGVISDGLWAGFKLVAVGVAEAVDFTEVWAFVLAKAGAILVQAGADYLRVTLDLVNALAIGMEELGVGDPAAMDAIGDRLFSALTAADAMVVTMDAWADGIDVTNDKLGTTTALLGAAEAAAKLISISGGSGRTAGDTPEAVDAEKALKEALERFDQWIDSYGALGQATFGAMQASAGELAGVFGDVEQAMLDYVAFWEGLKADAIGSLGNLGGVINAAIEGAATGGLVGGIAAGGMAALGSSAGFNEMVAGIDAMLASIMDTLGPVFDGLGPVVGALTHAVTTLTSVLDPLTSAMGGMFAGVAPLLEVFTTLGPAFQMLFTILAPWTLLMEPLADAMDTAFRVLFEVLSFIAKVILNVVLGLQLAWNAIVGALADFVGVFADILGSDLLVDLEDSLNDMKADTGETKDALDALNEMTYDSALAQATAAVATDEMAEAAAEATEALTNVPSGYKVALERFNAMAADASTADASVTGAVEDILAAAFGFLGSSSSTTGGRTPASMSAAEAAAAALLADLEARGGATGGSRSRRGRGTAAPIVSYVTTIGSAKLSAHTITDLAISGEAEAQKRARAQSSLPIGTGSRLATPRGN